MSRIALFLNHPAVSAVVGMAMIASGIDATLEEWGIEQQIGWLSAHHGIMLAGLTQGLRGMVDALEGANRLSGGAEEGGA